MEFTYVNHSAGADATSSGAEALLEATGLIKHYDGVVALNGANFGLRTGEIMGLVGDNGAGKSTLIKSISGVVRPDRGQITLEGKQVYFRGPGDALASGIETVYQDLSLVEPVSALGNIFLGRELLRRGRIARVLRLVDDAAMRGRAEQVLQDLGARIPSLRTPVHDMSGGQRQSLAIARALLWNRRIVILDEPTAALGVRESRHVLDMIRHLKERGASVIVISHNVEQLMGLADRVTVLRLGRTVGVRTVAQTTPAELVSLITGASGADAENGSASN
jgi:ABC-type sugar transport system ATPase subunit